MFLVNGKRLYTSIYCIFVIIKGMNYFIYVL